MGSVVEEYRGNNLVFCDFVSLQDYVYVYDGIPSFMTSSSTSNAMLLAAFCGLYGLTEEISVEAKSGYVTVFFEGNVAQSK